MDACLKSFKTIFLVLVVSSCSLTSAGQIAFYKENQLFITDIAGQTKNFGTDVKIKRNKIKNPLDYYTYSTMPKEVLMALPITKGMTFYSALKSQDGNCWLFVERILESYDYNFCMYDHKKKTKKIIFSQNSSPDKRYAFKPIACSKSKNVYYLEALIFGSSTEHEGIWEYNITSKRFYRLPIDSAYLTTPIISPDRNFFVYGATSEIKDLESKTDVIYKFDLQKNKEIQIVKDKQSFFSIIGWVEKSIKKSDIISHDQNDLSQKKI